MAYITKSNANRILRIMNPSSVRELEGTVYKKPIYFLSAHEINYLLLMQTLLKEPEKFIVEVYVPVVNVDTYKLVYESEQPPSFHTYHDCEKLNSDFKNFEIPFEIKDRANKQGGEVLEKAEVIRFRTWFKKYFQLFQDSPSEFLKKLDIDWNVSLNLREIERENSGIGEVENLNLNELEREIDKIISEAGKFFHANPDKQTIIKRFSKLTFLGYLTTPIYSNETGLADDELKEFLRYYDQMFKKPTKKLLLEYYKLLYNPKLEFRGKLLEQLNFRECSLCKVRDNAILCDGPDIPDYHKFDLDINDIPL
jgi:hypothetical protein